MKLAPTAVGAEPKKLAILGGILVVAGGIYWFETRSDSPTVSASVNPPQTQIAPRSAADAARTADPAIPVPQRRASSSSNQRSGGEDFRPTMKVKDDLDVSKVDPRIRLDLLAKVREAPMEGGISSLFEFGKAPEPPTPKVSAINPGPMPVPVPPPAVKPSAPKPPPGPPPPPPIPFKYYGYGKFPNGQLQGFFLEGDPLTGEISAAREGDTIKNRYKIVRIGIKSAVVEDTTTHNEQTLRLLDEAQ